MRVPHHLIGTLKWSQRIALVLGETCERSYHLTMMISDNQMFAFMLGRPTAIILLAATAITLLSTDERPDELLEARELGSEIEAAIGRLRPDYRTAILLRHVEGYSYDEIAQVMDVPLGTVKTYIHRARNELKEALVHLTEP